MTTIHFVHARPSRTLARSRLLLGVSAVGTCVMWAALMLGFDLAPALLSASRRQPIAEATLSVSVALALLLLAGAPFDLVGGAVFVRRRMPAAVWLSRWLRGAGVQLAIWTTAATLLMASARLAGPSAALGLFAILQLVLASGRARIAALAAALPRAAMSLALEQLLAAAARDAGIPVARIRIVESADEGFTGGWVGVTASRLIVPSSWLRLRPELLAAILSRRAIIARSGAHAVGVLGAALWNTVGAALVLLTVVGDAGAAAGMLEFSAGMTLWSFAGLVLLPTPSRGAVYAADAHAASAHGQPMHTAVVLQRDLPAAIAQLDRWQDDEPTRSRWIETVFHPIPAAGERIARLGASAPKSGAQPFQQRMHHVARNALYMSWAGLTPISRAVHCNVGRPSLLVMLPGD